MYLPLHLYNTYLISKFVTGCAVFERQLSFRGRWRDIFVFPAFVRSRLAWSRARLDMVAQARPSAADCSKWLFELARSRRKSQKLINFAPKQRMLNRDCECSEQQNARRMRMPLGPPRRRRRHDGCRSSLPWGRSMAAARKMAARSCWLLFVLAC